MAAPEQKPTNAAQENVRFGIDFVIMHNAMGKQYGIKNPKSAHMRNIEKIPSLLGVGDVSFSIADGE